MTLNCMRYKLDKIVITFQSQIVPEIVKIRLSDISPPCSFSIPSSQKSKSKKSQ